MATFSGLGVDRVEDDKIYLKGKVGNIRDDESYCLYFADHADQAGAAGVLKANNLKMMPSSDSSRTLIEGDLSGMKADGFDLKEHGCYIPEDEKSSHLVGIGNVSEKNCTNILFPEDQTNMPTYPKDSNLGWIALALGAGALGLYTYLK